MHLLFFLGDRFMALDGMEGSARCAMLVWFRDGLLATAFTRVGCRLREQAERTVSAPALSCGRVVNVTPYAGISHVTSRVGLLPVIGLVGHSIDVYSTTPATPATQAFGPKWIVSMNR